MRFSLDWLREFVDVDLEPDRLAAHMSVSGFEVGSWETFRDPDDPSAPADAVFEIDITANRPDTMNHLGLAREIAAILGLPLKPVSFELREAPEPASSAARVEIEAWDLCPRYVGRVVTGARAGGSPAWLRRRLAAIGVGSKNCIVDASNYVLFELGQPLHAFDLRTLAGGGVLVRRARAGEKLVTVADREEKTLGPDMLVIGELGSPGRPGPAAAIAGVMGGLATAITDATTEVLIESAWFDPRSVRRTARALSMHSDASHRFERGADPGMTRFAADRLAALIAELSGGRVLTGVLDPRAPGSAPAREAAPAAGAGGPSVCRLEIRRRDEPIPLRPARLEALLGIGADRAAIVRTLERLSIAASPGPEGEPILCQVPTWRGDLTREVDLIEEYARLTGYDAIPETLPVVRTAPARDGAGEGEDRARAALVALAYREAISYSMISPFDDALFGPIPSLRERGPAARLAIGNPLSDRWEIMRRSLLPGLARALAFNLARGRLDLRLFEVASVHARGADGAPIERRAAAIGASGLGADPRWPSQGCPYDLLDLKGAIEALYEALAGEPAGAAPGGTAARLVFEPPDARCGEDWPFHPRQSFLVLLDGRPAGRGGRARAEVEKALESDRPLFLAELELEPLLGAIPPASFRPLPRLNPVERDLSFFVERRVPFADIERAVAEALASLASSETGAPTAFLVDRFEGGPVPAGKVSYAFRFRFVQRERALTAEELNGAVDGIARGLASGVGAEIRSR